MNMALNASDFGIGYSRNSNRRRSSRWPSGAHGIRAGFVPQEYRNSNGGDLRLSDLYELDQHGTPTGNFNPNADWQGVIDALNTARLSWYEH
jgi:hypothetical protein